MNKKDKAYYVQEILHLKPELWPQLLNITLPKADVIEFVADKDSQKSLKPFLSYLTDEFSSRWRWQCKQFGDTNFFRFSLTPDLINYLLTVPKLDDWIDNYPEDPALYKDDEALLWTISHDGVVFVLLTEKELHKLNASGFSLEKVDRSNPPTIRP